MNCFISLQRLLVRRNNPHLISLEAIHPVPALDIISLNCFVFDDELEKMFTVKVPKTDNVSILKDLIKEKKAPHLDHVAASDIHLWKVDLRPDELGEDPVHVDLNVYLNLSPTKKLSLFF